MKNSIDAKEQLQIFSEILVYLQLTNYEGIGDRTNAISEYLTKSNLSEYLTKRVANAASKAYIESKGVPDKYISLCAKYVAQSSNDFIENKQRHGCVTAWLIFMIIGNSLSALLYLFAGDYISKNIPGGISNTMLIILALLGICNVVFSVMLFQWKKWAFWGFVITCLAAFALNLSIGLGISQIIFGLVGFAVLYGVLQIKKDNISAWANLE